MTAAPQVTLGGTRSTGAPAATRPRRRRNARRIRRVVVTVVMLPVCLVWIYPFLWMVSASLKTDTELVGSANLIPTAPQWHNYARAWYEANVGPYFWNTVIITVATVALVTATTAMMGYVLGRYTFPGKRIVLGALVATMFLPQGFTIIPIFDLVTKLGLAGSRLGIILAESGSAHVIIILLFAGYFRQLPRELEEAARIDGAGFLRTFGRVMLPLAKPVIATSVIMSLQQVWNSFLIPLVLTLTRPETRTLAVGTYAFQGENLNDYSGLAAASTISLLPIVLVFLLLQRYFVEGVAGAIRG